REGDTGIDSLVEGQSTDQARGHEDDTLMPGLGSQPCPKPEKRARVKRRRQRKEDLVEQRVRALCVERDGDCRIGNATKSFGLCSGESEWAHLGESRRFK